jgi:hypothetical protein
VTPSQHPSRAAHLPAEDLADVDAVAAHPHLADCERCRAEWEQQRAVRDLLRGLPDPGALPPEVAADLDHALARLTPDDVLAPDDAVPDQDGTPTAGATVVPLASSTRRDLGDRLRPWLAAAAAVVVLGGGGAALVAHPWSSGGDAATSAGSSADSSAGAHEESARRDASSTVVSTGTDYRRDGFADQVRSHLLAGQDLSSVPTPLALASGDQAGTRLAAPQGLSSCLAALGVDPAQVTAVDLARFEGEQAAVIVLRAEGGGEDVWVVGRGCRQGDDQTRFFERLP